MKKELITAISFLSLIPAGILASETHAIFESSRTYMDHTVSYTDEYWLAEGKMYWKRNNRVFIEREDLGLMWSIDLRARTYTERKIEKDRQVPEEQEQDIHSLGYSYDPDYDWEVIDNKEEKGINGFPCKGFVIDGDADFTEIKIQLWICTDAQIPGSAELHRLLVNSYKNDSQRKPIADILEKYPKSFPVFQEETIENPIAPTMTYRINLQLLEKIEPPAGIFELPEGFEKQERR